MIFRSEPAGSAGTANELVTPRQMGYLFRPRAKKHCPRAKLFAAAVRCCPLSGHEGNDRLELMEIERE